MSGSYPKIIVSNLAQIFQKEPNRLELTLPAACRNNGFEFEAFGRQCRLSPAGIELDHRVETGVLGVLVSLYALHAKAMPQVLEPFKSFKDLPQSMPYAGAFTTHTETPLISRVAEIEAAQPRLFKKLSGSTAGFVGSGDFAFLVRPLPKITLCYVFYHADDEFPASATCLFSNNASDFMPTDGLADVGEYTSKEILALLG
jgi:hypothetical protein